MKDQPGNFCQTILEKEQDFRSLYIQNMGKHHYAPGEGWGPGRKEYFQICHVLQGKGEYRVDGQVYELTAGDTFLICPHIGMEVVADAHDPWECISVGFSGDDAPALMEQSVLNRSCLVLFGQAQEQIRPLLEDICRYRGAEKWERLVMMATLYRLLAELNRLAPAKETRGEAEACARLVARYIMHHYEERVTVEALAEYARVSHSSLYRYFVKCFGISPKRYLLEYRIARACELLETTDCSVQEVSNSVGFEDPFYFSRAFKELKGLSPRQYANAAKSGS